MVEFTRRQAVTAAAGMVLASATSVHAQADSPLNAQGRVFDQASGQGIAGVMVSNGLDVVKTDADGHWALSVQPANSLFVIKPRGWMTPTDPETGLSRAVYLYQPDGTPANLNLRFAGVAPTGPVPTSIDFALTKQDEPDQFDALLFTDPQPESLAELGYVRDDVVAATAGVQARFGISTGDLMFDDLSYYPRYNRIVGAIGLPWWNCCGNHDMNLEAPDDTFSRETYKRVFGARYGAFQWGGATVFLLDNVEYLGADATKPNSYGKYRGRFGQRQIAFVRNVLANVPQDAPVVVCFHIPLRTLVGTDPNIANTDTDDLLAALSGHPNAVSFAGHTHTNEHWYLDAPGGTKHHHHVLSAVSGSWWSGPYDERGIPIALATDGAPNGFHILSVDGSQVTTRLVPARDPARSQLRLVLDGEIHRATPELLHEYAPGALLTGPIAQMAAGATRLVANLYDGGPRSKLTMTVGRGGRTVPMAKVERNDPFVEEVYARNTATKKPWVSPGASSHLWQATLPADLAPGTHRIEVNATDEHGRPHSAWMLLEVTA